MNLHRLLLARASAGKPVTVALIGAGKFGTMYLAQARVTDGIHVAMVCDLNPARAASQLALAGWPAERHAARSLDEAFATGATYIGDDAMAAIRDPRIEVIVEATGDPRTGIRLCLEAISHGKHIVMVNVEADVVAGPLLAKKAAEAGVVYSLAWGDQPAMICEMVDWARACGFEVVSAGKGTRYMPHYHQSNPDTVWDILKTYLNIDDPASINLKMFNSFVDGTKSGIEMTAVCNATGLVPQSEGLGFPPSSRFDLADVCKPRADGGTLEKRGVTEVVASPNRDGSNLPHNLVMGVYVVFEAPSDYAKRCIREYNLLPDQSGRFAALYRPTHMIGLELGISIASAALRREATGAAICFNSDVVATAKRDLKAGEMLDGEGGFCVWGKQTPAARSVAEGYLPLGLAHGVKLLRDVKAGDRLKKSDVALDHTDIAVTVREEMERTFAPALAAAAE